MNDKFSAAKAALSEYYQIDKDDRRIVCACKLLEDTIKTASIKLDTPNAMMLQVIKCYEAVSALDPALIETDEMFQRYLNNKAFW